MWHIVLWNHLPSASASDGKSLAYIFNLVGSVTKGSPIKRNISPPQHTEVVILGVVTVERAARARCRDRFAKLSSTNFCNSHIKIV